MLIGEPDVGRHYRDKGWATSARAAERMARQASRRMLRRLQTFGED
jgi:hypothetical protein